MSAGLDHARLDVVVHEVRSPVAALSAVAETVAERALDESVRGELVRLALAACRGIERIVMDLAIASIRSEPIDVGSLARDAAGSFEVRGADVAAEIGPEPLIVDADPVRLRQALDNLIANALRHGAPSKPVMVRVSRLGDAVKLAVADAGPGIPADELERIFEPGVQLDETGGGSGLGLALARAIVDAHGGRLRVESQPGDGSTFTIELPAQPTQPAT